MKAIFDSGTSDEFILEADTQNELLNIVQEEKDRMGTRTIATFYDDNGELERITLSNFSSVKFEWE
ncbi:MAG: hypothetical protein ACTSW7_00700 [Candidatus Thorarchaeota archaeon]|nr:MAG: hypothetical protein DRQ25_15420 [Candidatus Fermentibacteria bacterium]HEC72579.1 hypothetical protein [Thermoplasmatales archaeon]